MATLKQSYRNLTVGYVINLITAIHSCYHQHAQSDVLGRMMVVPNIPLTIYVLFLQIYHIDATDIQFTLPFEIMYAAIASALFNHQITPNNNVSMFARRLSHNHKLIKWSSKILCILFSSIPILIAPILFIAMASPTSITKRAQPLIIATIYQILFILPCLIHYTITLDENSTYLSWIAFISCIFYVLYFSTNTMKHVNDMTKLLQIYSNYINDKLLSADILMLLILIRFISNYSRDGIMPNSLLLSILFIISIPFYKSGLMMRYNRWLKTSLILQCRTHWDHQNDYEEQMDIMYAYRHNVLYHEYYGVRYNGNIAQCMKLHRNWKGLSVTEKHVYLKTTFGIKYYIEKLDKICYGLLFMLNCFVPLLILMIQGMQSIVLVILFIDVMYLVIGWLSAEYKNISKIWKVSDIVLIAMMDRTDLLDVGFEKRRINYTIEQVEICDVMGDFFPLELAIIVIQCLTTACDDPKSL